MNKELLCEGKTPFLMEGKNKDEARKANKNYYGLKGLVSHTKPPCPHCGRKACHNRQGCKSKRNKQKESKAVMVEKYFTQ